MRRRHIHELLAIHGSCKIVNGSDHIERLGQNLQLFWFCTFSYFPLDGCKHYRPYQKKLTACLCLPHRRRLHGPWFSSWAITIPNINKGPSINDVGNFSGFLTPFPPLPIAEVNGVSHKYLDDFMRLF